MHRIRRVSVAALALSLIAVACGDPAVPGGGEGNGGEARSVGMALPGPKNDGAWAQVHYEGLLASGEKHGLQTAFLENLVDPQARIDALENLAADNDLVIAAGGEFAEPGLIVAPQFPNVHFAVVNGETSPDVPNLHAYTQQQGVPAYVAGVIAADLTKTKNVGFVGGLLIPPTIQGDEGFKAGVQATDSSIEYASTIVGSFDDPEKAKEAASAQIQAGADVLFAMLSTGFSGAVQAVAESGNEVLLINSPFPRCDESEDIVGAVVQSSQALVDQIFVDFLSGELPTEPRFYGVENLEIQRFELCDGWEQYQGTVDALHEELAAGDIELP